MAVALGSPSAVSSVKVLSYESKTDELGKEYQILRAFRKLARIFSFVPASRQVVSRRYTDFENLYAWVSEAYPTVVKGVDMPSKFTLFKSADAIGKERVPILQNVLDAFGRQTGVASTWEYREFLGLKNLLPPHPEGLLYCLVESVKGVQLSGSINVKVAVGRSNLKALHGEEVAFKSDNHTVKNNTAFVFDEFELRVADAMNPKPLNVYLLQGGSAYGVAALDISKFPANLEVRHTVALAKADGSLTTMEVTLITFFMPMPAVNILKAVKTLEHFRLELDKPDATFNAGDTISGRAILRVTVTQTNVAGIDFHVRGHAEAKWHHQQREFKESTSIFDNKWNIFSQGHPMFSASAGASKFLPPGLYRVPFSVILPTTLVPSVQLPHGHIAYNIMLEKATGSFIPQVITKDITIRAPSFHPPLPLPPIGYSNLFKFESGFFGTQNLHVHVSLRFPVFYIGYANVLGLGIVNNSQKEIQGLKVRLVGCANYKAKMTAVPGQPNDDSHHHKDEDFVALEVHNHQHVQILPDRRVDLNVDLLTPSSALPTLAKAMTHQIDVSYHLIIEIIMAGTFGSSPTIIKFPVTVSHPPKEVLPILLGQVPFPNIAPPVVIGAPVGVGVAVGPGMGMNVGMGMPQGNGMQMQVNMNPNAGMGMGMQASMNPNANMAMAMGVGAPGSQMQVSVNPNANMGMGMAVGMEAQPQPAMGMGMQVGMGAQPGMGMQMGAQVQGNNGMAQGQGVQM